MSGQRVAILTALWGEARAAARAFDVVPPRASQPAHVNRQGISIELHLIGIRATRMPVLERSSLTCILLAGFGGALDPSLRVGDVVVEGLPEPSQSGLRFRPGRIHTSEAIVATAEEKASLFTRSGAVAVDMESDVVREYAHSMGVPFAAVRAISDAAEDAIDPAVLRLVDEWGRPKPGAVASTLLRRPALLPHLMRLGANANRAATSLTAALPPLISSLT